MNKAIHDGRSDDGIRKEATPFIKIKIAGQNKGALFVSNGNELAKEIGLMIGDGGKAHFIDNNQVKAREEGQLVDKDALFFGKSQLFDECLSGREIDTKASGTSFDTKCNCQMTFPDARGPEKNDIFFSLNKIQGS